MVRYRRMGNMVRHLGNTTSTTSLHHLRELWKSPRGTVLRIQTLAIAAIAITFFLVAFGSCRRWSSRWIVQKGFFAAQALSLSLGTYSIGLMQSSSVRSEMYPIWTASLFTLFGCIDPVTNYNGFDYKGPLSKVVYAICLYCGYAMLMSISGVSSVVGNIAICMLSAITFIKGIHRTLAFVQQSRMRNTVARLDDDYKIQTSVLVYPSTDGKATVLAPGWHLIVQLVNDNTDEHVLLGHVLNLLSRKEKEKEKEKEKGKEKKKEKKKRKNPVMDQSLSEKEKNDNSDMVDYISQKEKKHNLWSCYASCVAYGLSHSLQRHFLGLSSRKVRPEPLERIDYKWGLKVVAMELAFLHDIFSTGNAFLYYYQARASCLWALASFIGICFLGVAVAIPGAVTSSRGVSTNVVGTTTADLVITFGILVFLALLQLMQLFWCWTSNWARLAVACAYARNKRRQDDGIGPSNGRQQLWSRLMSSLGLDKFNKWIPNWRAMWMRLRSFMATRTKLFDKYLWQEMIGQYSVLAEDGVSLTVTRSDYRDDNRGCVKLFGLDYIQEVLWDLLGSDTNKRGAIPLDEVVKEYVTDFLDDIDDGILEGSWSSYPGHLDIEALFLPYACAPQFELEPQGSRYARCVFAWCVATLHYELAEQEQEQELKREGGGRRKRTDASNNLGNEPPPSPPPATDATSNNLGKEEAVAASTDASNNQGKEAATDASNNLGKEAAAAATDASNNLGKEPEAAAAEATDAAKGAVAKGGDAKKATADKTKKYRHVAKALSKYCAYLVVSVPELLPGRVVDTRRACDFFADSAWTIARDKDRLLKQVSHPGYWEGLYRRRSNLDEDVRKSIFSATRGARPLVDVTRRQECWKTLAAVWVRMLVYAAPYGSPEAHMRQLSQGGEFITHLWALLYHLGIRDWKPPGANRSSGGGLLTKDADAKQIISNFSRENEAVVVAFLHSEYGYYTDELDAASKLEKRVSFYWTTSPEIASLFQITPPAKRPSLVLLNKEEEDDNFAPYEGEFNRYAIAKFVSVNKLPLVTKLTQKTVSSLDAHPIHKLIILFADAEESKKFLPVFKEAAKMFRGKLLFVFVQEDDEENNQAASKLLGLDSSWSFWRNGMGKETMKFAKDFHEDKLYLSETPAVKTVVGSNLDQIVLDESKDVLLVIYEPDGSSDLNFFMAILNNLAKHMGDIDSLVIAKMDCTANWHPHANKYKKKDAGDILFYPAKRKHFEPIIFNPDDDDDMEPSVKELYKFIKKHAGIQFNPISMLEDDVSMENGGPNQDEIQEIS